MSSFGGPRLILTVPGGSSRPNKTSSVKKSKFSKLSLMPFCQITAELSHPALILGLPMSPLGLMIKEWRQCGHPQQEQL